MRRNAWNRRAAGATPLSDWRESVMRRDQRQCQLAHLDRCSGELAAHHVVFKSRDSSRRADVDNGATLCRRHHDWVHAHAEEARERYGLAGHAEDIVRDGRVVMHPRPNDIHREVMALALLRPKGLRP